MDDDKYRRALLKKLRHIEELKVRPGRLDEAQQAKLAQLPALLLQLKEQGWMPEPAAAPVETPPAAEAVVPQRAAAAQPLSRPTALERQLGATSSVDGLVRARALSRC